MKGSLTEIAFAIPLKRNATIEIWAMANRNVKWIVYTVVVGLIPALMRLLLWVVTQNHRVPLLNATDFIIFGLVLHISNINEIEHFHSDQQWWKTIHNGSSILFIVMYAVLFACQTLGQTNPELISATAVLMFTLPLSAVSLLLSISVYYRLSKMVP